MRSGPYILSFLLLSILSSAASDFKIGSVDMLRIFAEYHRTTEADKRVNEEKAIIKKELDDRNAKYKELIEKYRKLAKGAADPLISDELRVSITAEAEAVAAEVRSLEREKAELAQRRERQLLEQVRRERLAILMKIEGEVTKVSKEENYDVVFDKSGLGTHGTRFLQYAKDAVDFSEMVIASLNADAE
ncbi:MAG: OmpH family outer membrane protein [Verrucomicrobiota bacterium]